VFIFNASVHLTRNFGRPYQRIVQAATVSLPLGIGKFERVRAYPWRTCICCRS